MRLIYILAILFHSAFTGASQAASNEIYSQSADMPDAYAFQLFIGQFNADYSAVGDEPLPSQRQIWQMTLNDIFAEGQQPLSEARVAEYLRLFQQAANELRDAAQELRQVTLCAKPAEQYTPAELYRLHDTVQDTHKILLGAHLQKTKSLLSVQDRARLEEYLQDLKLRSAYSVVDTETFYRQSPAPTVHETTAKLCAKALSSASPPGA